jgi:uncharacterized RDD family membrane protein YckC
MAVPVGPALIEPKPPWATITRMFPAVVLVMVPPMVVVLALVPVNFVAATTGVAASFPVKLMHPAVTRSNEPPLVTVKDRLFAPVLGLSRL